MDTMARVSVSAYERRRTWMFGWAGGLGAEECVATAVCQPAEVEPSASSTVASALRRRASTVPTT